MVKSQQRVGAMGIREINLGTVVGSARRARSMCTMRRRVANEKRVDLGCKAVRTKGVHKAYHTGGADNAEKEKVHKFELTSAPSFYCAASSHYFVMVGWLAIGERVFD
jgi:hypothetical protein